MFTKLNKDVIYYFPKGFLESRHILNSAEFKPKRTAFTGLNPDKILRFLEDTEMTDLSWHVEIITKAREWYGEAQ